MAKHTLTHKKLQNDSGHKSGLYLFRDGVLVFSPLTEESVSNLVLQSLKHGPVNMVKCFEHMAMNAKGPAMVPHRKARARMVRALTKPIEMDTIYKYTLPIQDRVELKIPGGGGEVRLVAAQNGNLCIWMEVDTERAPEDTVFHIVGTGHPLDRVAGMAYWGSAVVGDFVWHVYGE